jgi:hypothetical protein
MVDYKILVIESNGTNWRTIIKAIDTHSALRIAEGMFSSKQVKVVGPCYAVGY